MPSGPGVISDEVARAIALATSPPVATFLLTSETTAEGIARHVEAVGPSVVQVVHHLAPRVYERLSRTLPRHRAKRVQVIHVEGADALELLDAYAAHVDAFLLDSGRPSAAVPELGGTGRVHDWSVSAEFVRRSPRPVFLAGGLTPANVASALRAVRPYGLDLCTGVRTDGALDEKKLRRFLQAVAEADRPLAR
jgi:phosphoribosylanthranilate isomerase